MPTWGVHTARDVAEEVKVALRAMATPGGLRGIAMEAVWLTAHAVLYPWGAITEQLRPDGHFRHYRTDGLPPRQRGLVVSAMDAAGTPIVLVHGIGDNRSAFAVLSGALRRRGFGVVHAINYSVLTALTGDVRRSAALLGAHIERICEQTGSDQVHVVGHSLGGLIARYYVQRLHGDSRVRTLVTLGTPHHGTLAAYLLPTPTDQAAATGFRPADRARRAVPAVPHPVRRGLVRDGSGHRAAAQRPTGALVVARRRAPDT